jgi:hypothetical protein
MTPVRGISILSALAFVHCVSTRSSIPSHPTSSYVFRELFSDATVIQAQWVAVIPKIAEASAEIENAALQLKMPPNAEGDIVFRHRLDVSDLGGKRVRLTARVRADVAAEDESTAFAMLTVTPSRTQPSYSD